MRTVVFGICASLILLSGVMAIVMLEYTVVNLWLFFGVILMVTVGTGIALRGVLPRIIQIPNPIVCVLLYVLGMTALLSATILTVNFITSDSEKNEIERAIIEKKSIVTRYRTVRNGRHGSSRGAPYKVYFLTLGSTIAREMPDSSRSFSCGDGYRVEVTKKLYDSIATGDTVTIPVERGIFGMRIIEGEKITPLHPRKKRRGRCRFFGTSGRKTVAP